ncbi:MAG: hypothetical protein A3D74_01390 [Candidatus Levybacteria bacterium RIFCSPHIGHO2_02_FULL_37_13]|nr:MAG: hypothetical protein A3D74_01390 [Candidatus Levybacteria bacterium RIFCSPHIGHO2_02_FULL_37_13]OGH39524.1 MAG: hypothetical protein A3B41_01275 [Candidatus Levybacteria bacterium RIFCSPLOWO2_01_FULL_37_26]
MSKKIKLTEPISGIIKQTTELIKLISRNEFETGAGRVNVTFGILLFVLTLVIIIPDYIFGFINAFLITFNRKLLPQLPELGIMAYLFLLLAFFAWCVWYVGRSERTKRDK